MIGTFCRAVKQLWLEQHKRETAEVCAAVAEQRMVKLSPGDAGEIHEALLDASLIANGVVLERLRGARSLIEYALKAKMNRPLQ